MEMTNIKHHAIIVTSNEKQQLEAVRKKAIELYDQFMEANKGRTLVGQITIGLINNFYSFMITPDGSKEGYDVSEDGDLVRKKICDFIDSLKNTKGYNSVRFVEVSFGSDDGFAEIISHN